MKAPTSPSDDAKTPPLFALSAAGGGTPSPPPRSLRKVRPIVAVLVLRAQTPPPLQQESRRILTPTGRGQDKYSANLRVCAVVRRRHQVWPWRSRAGGMDLKKIGIRAQQPSSPQSLTIFHFHRLQRCKSPINTRLVAADDIKVCPVAPA